MKFKAEDRVRKIGGSYQAIGTVKAAWLADDGTPRYVFRFDTPSGMLHIFNETQLEAYTDSVAESDQTTCPYVVCLL